MKKLLTLLTLVLLGMGSAWAASPSDPSISSLTAKSFTETTLLWTTPSNATTWYNAGWVVGGKSGSRATFSAVTGKKYTINPETDETVAATACEGLGIKNNSDTKTVYFCVTNVTAVDIYVISNGGSERTARMTISNNKNSDKITKTGAAPANSSAKISADGLDPEYTYLIKVDETAGTDMTLYAIRFTAPKADVPSISASPESITLNATESGVSVNKSFTITGSKLSAGTYNLNIPTVTGLSVSPTSFTVADDGTVNQVVSVSFSSTVNVPINTVNITATVGELNLSVAVKYSASVASWILQTISEAKTWDFSKLSGGIQYTTDEDKNTERVYAGISEITFPDGFDATALAFKGEYPLRSGKGFAQNGTLHFITSVPGTIVVKFSDTGTSASGTAVKRYLVVNGITTEYWASRENNGTENPYAAQLDVTTDEIAVPAGDVTITGTSAQIYTYVKFTPTVDVTVPATGFTTYVNSANALNFEGTGITPYVIKTNTDATKVSLVAKTSVAAGEPVLLYADGGATKSVPVAATATADADNLLVAGTGAKVKYSDTDQNYILWTNGDGVTGFYRANSTDGNTVAVGKAYLHIPSGNGARFFSLDLDGETTAINSVNVNVNENGCFDLQGRRVAQPTKGLYIVNGKKVVIK